MLSTVMIPRPNVSLSHVEVLLNRSGVEAVRSDVDSAVNLKPAA